MNALTSAWALVFLGQAASEASPALDAAAAVRVQSVWDFVIKGGPMMIPIALSSLVALTVIIERVLSLRRRNIIPPGFLPGLKEILSNGDDDREEVLEYCRANGSPIARVFAAGVKKLSISVELVEKHIQEAGQREVLKLRKHLRSLSVIASVAPLMGLLGTIFGMITAFQTVALSAESLGKAELLAKGIYQAMITTAAGLMVAIPVLIAYHWISAKIDQLVTEMDQMTVDFVEEYAQPPLEDERLESGGGRSRRPKPVARGVEQSVEPAEEGDENEQPAAVSV